MTEHPIVLHRPAANLQRSPATGQSLTCHGCKHTRYSAPGGQKGLDYPGRPAILSKPHSRCVALNVYVPMILDGDKWIGSDVPRECPEHRQPELFDTTGSREVR